MFIYVCHDEISPMKSPFRAISKSYVRGKKFRKSYVRFPREPWGGHFDTVKFVQIGTFLHLRKAPSAPELCQPFFFESAANSVLKKESTLVASKLLSLIFSLAVFDCLLQYKKLELQIIRLFWKPVLSTVLWIFSMFSSVINCNGHFSNIVIVPAPQFPHFFLFKTVLTLLRFPVIPPSKSTLAPELCQPFFFESAANSVLKKESTLVASKLLSLIFSLAVFDCLLQYKKLELQIIRLFWKPVLSTVLWIFSMFSSVINCNGHFSNIVIVPAP